MLTDTSESLRGRLAAAQVREREARASAARIRRELAAADRRRETQRLCTIGRAVEAWAGTDERVAGAFRRYLASYISRPADVDVLRSTPWELPAAAPAHIPASDQGGDHG